MTADIARLRADAQYLNETGCRMVATWNIVNAANDHQQLTAEVERLKAQRAKDVAILKEAGANVVAERDRLRDELAELDSQRRIEVGMMAGHVSRLRDIIEQANDALIEGHPGRAGVILAEVDDGSR